MTSFIEKRSPFTRWIMSPFVFIISAFLIHGSVVIFSKIASIFWGADAQFNLWFYDVIIAEVLSAFCAVYFASLVAPNYNLIVAWFCASVIFFLNLFILYSISIGVWWDMETIFTILCTTIGAGIAIYKIKNDY